MQQLSTQDSSKGSFKMPDPSDTPLRAELEAFESRKPELEKAYPLKFVVFKGSEFVGAWDTLDAAAAEAAVRFGRGPYLIRQVGAPHATLPASVLFRHLAPI
jgi:hypothetical protein